MSDPHRARRSPGRVKFCLIFVVPYFEVLYVTSLVVTELFTILNLSAYGNPPHRAQRRVTIEWKRNFANILAAGGKLFGLGPAWLNI